MDLRRIASSAPVQRAGGSFRELRELVAGEDDEGVSPESFLLGLARAVRKDEQGAKERGPRDVYVVSRKRRRRLGLAAFGTGPMIGVANQLADLYCEAAIIGDVAALHGMDMSDEGLATHMLVLWGIVENPEQGRRIFAGDPPLASLLASKLLELAGEQMPATLTKRSAIKALWDVRGLIGGVREGRSTGAVRTVLFTGHRTKKLIKKAEAQLGVAAR
jgi:hypothetical protein